MALRYYSVIFAKFEHVQLDSKNISSKGFLNFIGLFLYIMPDIMCNVGFPSDKPLILITYKTLYTI